MQLVIMQLCDVNSSCELEGFVIIVSVILKFCGEEKTSQ